MNVIYTEFYLNVTLLTDLYFSMIKWRWSLGIALQVLLIYSARDDRSAYTVAFGSGSYRPIRFQQKYRHTWRCSFCLGGFLRGFSQVSLSWRWWGNTRIGLWVITFALASNIFETICHAPVLKQWMGIRYVERRYTGRAGESLKVIRGMERAF